MKAKSMVVLVAMMFTVAEAMAAEGEDGFQVEGAVSAGAITSSTNTGTKDEAKLKEYRDLSPGALGSFDIKGRGSQNYFDAFGENLGRDDQYMEVKGGQYTIYKYQLYDNRIIHNWTFDARTPYAGVGTSTLTATLPSLNSDSWNKFDFRQKQNNVGGMFEVNNNSPWYIRLDANQSKSDGLKLIAGSNGTSPGNGFTDKPFPIDFTTRTAALEGGYASKQGQLSLGIMHSRFTNDNEILRWQNNFFGGLDTTTLPPDGEMSKASLNGNLKQLPMGSTLAGRLTYSKARDDVSVLSSILSTGGLMQPTNSNRSTFGGDIVHETASLSLFSNPSKAVDTRIYWNWFMKDNRSPEVTFTGLGTSGLACGRVVLGATVINPGDCVTEQLNYKKNNYGADVGYRFNAHNRMVFGLDYVKLERDRVDFDTTKDTRATVEYKNTSLDSLSARVKYQYLERRSHFLESKAGVDANDPDFLNRFIARFDAADVNQNLLKFVLDATPAEYWDLSLEGILKHNDYQNTVLGRTKDNRQQLYFSVGYGDAQKFRVLMFADVEFIQYDSTHRNISTVSSGAGAAPNDTPSGNCQSTAPNCYDPNTAPTNSNYNWDATNKDKNYAVGFGADWLPAKRWKFSGSLLWERTYGTVDFAVQTGANPTVPEVQIPNYDSTRKVSLNLKTTYKQSENWEVTGGYSYERFRFSDIQYDGYRYTIPSGTSTSYLSGAYAFPNYAAHIVYLVGTYKF